MAKFTRIAVLPLFLLLFFTVGASAEYTLNKAYFMDKYPDLTRQDFSESTVPVGGDVFCTGPLNASSNNACMPAGTIHPDIFFTTFPGIGANNLWMLGQHFSGADNPNNALVAAFNGNTFNINFDSAGVANVVGINIGCTSKLDFPDCIGPVSVETFGFGGSMIGGFELEVSDEFISFLGIASDESIRQVRITPIDPDSEIGLFVGVDAVYFGFFRNVPTMSEWGMIATVAGLGIIGFMVIRRRRKAFN